MLDHAANKLAGWDCASCGLPLTEYEVAIGYCKFCGSNQMVLDLDTED